MRHLTQTTFGLEGNCFQTCVACVLDLDPDTLPPQREYDRAVKREDGTIAREGPSYGPAINAYLREHHNLGYWEIHAPPECTSLLQIREPGLHFLTGRTVRSPGQGTRHVVVARHGEIVWDPHPSRAGLTEDIRWAFLVPFPESWRSFYNEPCECPACKTRAKVVA